MISIRPCVFRARIRRLKASLAAEKTNPPTLLLGEILAVPKLPSPWKPTIPGPTTGLVGRGPVLLKLNPGKADGLMLFVTVTPPGTRLVPVVGAA